MALNVDMLLTKKFDDADSIVDDSRVKRSEAILIFLIEAWNYA